MTHTAHHRGQQLALLRMLGREEHSNYGPTADTGGLMQNHAPTVYAYPDLQALFEAFLVKVDFLTNSKYIATRPDLLTARRVLSGSQQFGS